MSLFDVQCLLRRNSMILNSRPHHWRTVRRFALDAEARSYLAELRKGARESKLPYSYRLKIVKGG